MVSPRAVGAGVCSFPAVVVWAALTEPFALLLVGFVPGIVTAVLAEPGGRSGLVHGLLVGGLCTLLFWALFLWWARSSTAGTGYVAPGFGISVVLSLVFGLLVGIETVVGGLVVGLVRR